MSNTYNLKDLRDLKSGTFEEIPEGRYELQVADATAAKASSGNDIVNMKMKIMNGDFAGRVVWDTLVMTPNAFWKIKQFLEAAQSSLLDEEKINVEGIAMGIVGVEVSAFLEPGVDNKGNPRSNPKEYKPIDKPTKKGSSLIE